MISIEHKLAKLCNIEQNVITPYPFYSNFDDTNYQMTVHDLSVRLTEQSVTVVSITLRFDCTPLECL